MPPEEKAYLVEPFLRETGLLEVIYPCQIAAVLEPIVRAAGDRIKVAGDILDYTDLFVPDDQLIYDEKAFDRRVRGGDAAELLSRFKERVATVEPLEAGAIEAAMKQLSLVGLREKAFSHPGSLSWGQQKLVGLARALATGSELLLLDEPYSGLLSDEVDKLNQLIFELQSQGMTILIVEHLTDILMGIASQVIVLDYGEKIAEGTPIEIQKNKRVIDAYLGGEQLEDEGS